MLYHGIRNDPHRDSRRSPEFPFVLLTYRPGLKYKYEARPQDFVLCDDQRQSRLAASLEVPLNIGTAIRDCSHGFLLTGTPMHSLHFQAAWFNLIILFPFPKCSPW